VLAEGSVAQRAYGEREISERHRHRYEFNREYEETLKAGGLKITGETPDATYVEICEVADHPWFLGCQFHPEYKSKPTEPHPLFVSYIAAALTHKCERDRKDRPEPASTTVSIPAGEPSPKIARISNEVAEMEPAEIQAEG
jgi:CTP synthase